MYAATLAADAEIEAFRTVAKRCLALKLSPRDVVFVTPDERSLLPIVPEGGTDQAIAVPRAYGELLQDAICHSAIDRFALLYEVLWRITHGERDLVARAADPAIAKLNGYVKAVRRDIHKMHAFLRFHERKIDGTAVFTAWFEPQHYVLKRAVPFFVDRFTNMDWIIATPIGTVTWIGRELRYGPAVPKPEGDVDPVLDEVWLTYYRTTFNPARLRRKAMLAEMPKHYWANMPETSAIPGMMQDAQARVDAMHAQAPDAPQLFAERIAARGRPAVEIAPTPITGLRAQANACTRCPLYGPATQTVFGEGPEDARLVFVGEQPGDQEDLAGRPFVGPAGELFDRALREASIDRLAVYVTNAVKHFKYEPRGKRRIHKKPNTSEVQQCRWWLDRELTTIKPALVVALGATAAQALGGRAVSVLRDRGPTNFAGQAGFITVHPSFLLRVPEAARQADEYAKFVADLRAVRNMLAHADVAA